MSSSSYQISFCELVVQIEQLLTQKDRVFIAISGFGGSGKSQLANELRDHFNFKDTQIVRLDNLYSRNPDGPGILDQVNWPLVMQILEAAHVGGRLQYAGRGFRGEELLFDEELPRVLVFEGIRLLQPLLLSYFDIAIWIDCPQEVAVQRAKTRDRAQGEDELTINRWDSDWGPKDREYFDVYRPDQLATFLYEADPIP